MHSSSDKFAVVMAGGSGERFWPQSRRSNPKQLLRLIGNLTLIEQTIERLSVTFPKENIFIITNELYVEPMVKLIPSLRRSNIIGEPCRRDTAACMAAAAAYVKKISSADDPVLCFVPSDHVISDKDGFAQALSDSAELAQSSDKIVTLGITPTGSLPGFGYIKTGKEFPGKGKTAFREVVKFTEKPDQALADKYFAAGTYKWNSGIFVLRFSVLDSTLRAAAPGLALFMNDLSRIISESGWVPEKVASFYERLPEVSIDYAVMEKTKNLVVADASFDWDDVGSWTSMRARNNSDENGNVVSGIHTGLSTKDCIIVGGQNKLIATIDVDSLVIVDTEDALLVCSAKSAQRVKELVKLIGKDPALKRFL